MSTATHTLHLGTQPLLISMPHVGTQIPPQQRARYTERALDVEDTDWFLDRLYAFAEPLGASVLVPVHSRYLIDLNRASDNRPMYPGQNNTELCPTRHFTGEPLYREGQAPDEAEVRRRVFAYWQPYHQALHDELARLRAAHGHAVLLDAHSIKSELPWLFEGTLPHMNIGTVNGASCAPSLRAQVQAVFAAQDRYSHVMDGRFKGGHITREHGRPAEGVHAVQLEMCWRAYMDETPSAWNDARAEEVRPLLQALVQALIAWRPGA
ncbi:N-formylglutamate deformylase [Rubrivivax rivuli]|uniref:N-formylglutamate deformylase n=1 Tax=Rubrivivax rivuli TaxID=1862385 RepID=A0A437RCH6_9BURK|nr:N-formylglutamate deformylase [Rubrivivax rivuli]RVU44475.1 N-formylglutamate deformylase [Rubrivivax rivuli]